MNPVTCESEIKSLQKCPEVSLLIVSSSVFLYSETEKIMSTQEKQDVICIANHAK